MVILLLFYILFPAFIVWLCSKFSSLNKIGPILLLYLVGIIIGNIGVLDNLKVAEIQDNITSVMVVLAIPLMLFSCDFKSWSIRSALLTLFTGILAVVVAVITIFFILRSSFIDNGFAQEEVNKIAGLLCGVYTGGTLNLASLKLMLNIPSQTYIMVHSYDMIVSATYLMILLTFGIRLFRKILNKNQSKQINTEPLEIEKQDDYNAIFHKKNFLPVIGTFVLSILIAIISLFVSYLFTKGLNMIIIILLLTSLGIACSFIPKVRRVKKSFEAGMYLILIFSLVVASMVNFSQLNLVGGTLIFIYLICVVFGSLLIQTLLSKIFKIDADTMIISSTSLINSPPFVPLIATAMRNKSVIVTGMSVGLIGYAIGNYLGVTISYILGFIS